MKHIDVGSKQDEEHLRRLTDARIANLEKQIAFLIRVNGLDLSAFRNATDEELLTIYRDAVHMLSVIHRPVALEIIERWSNYFIQFSEYEFTRLQPIVRFDHTWEPFFLLCVKMMTQVRQDKKLGETPAIQQLFATLDKGRRNLRDAAVTMCRKYPDSLTAKGKVILKDNDLLAELK
ncbi:hypothetical protein UFOVP276_64 [uncultured Caudovirales phage]|uniref:Uncharacterized protein n=1 Tax=uncultured Caudovirales phage TaxID=2100421 RepID=A0A6J5LC56_9CAUD|nr:hypothetical protein UFOVP127_201 [uncultured Caudovirales phage]CAB4135080.1 hypothetical protein UFOVP276_64 [uncultured Caudovirales phage]